LVHEYEFPAPKLLDPENKKRRIDLDSTGALRVTFDWRRCRVGPSLGHWGAAAACNDDRALTN